MCKSLSLLFSRLIKPKPHLSIFSSNSITKIIRQVEKECQNIADFLFQASILLFEIYWHFLLVGSIQECFSPRAGYWKQSCNSSCLALASSEDQWTQDQSLPGTFLGEAGGASRVPAGWYCGWLQQTGTIPHPCPRFTLIKVPVGGGKNESGR